MRTLLQPVFGSWMPSLFFAGIVAAGIVAVLTWLAMPLLVRAARGWLRPPLHPAFGAEQRLRDQKRD